MQPYDDRPAPNRTPTDKQVRRVLHENHMYCDKPRCIRCTLRRLTARDKK